VNEEQRLIEKLQRIEALFAGAATAGERDAAAHARERIRSRLQAQQQTDPPVEFSFKLRDQWCNRLMVAVLRRYGLRPYRYPRQRYTTIMVRAPKRFVNETLWPEYVELNRTLYNYLSEVTERVIAQGITADASDVEIRPQSAGLGAATTFGGNSDSESD
jgi:hypothetical protein